MQLIYSGPLGKESSALIAYLEAVPGVHPITAGENPATWMLEVTGGASITGKSKATSMDFAEYYRVTLFLPSQLFSHHSTYPGRSYPFCAALGI
jgi:hypothetical protein